MNISVNNKAMTVPDNTTLQGALDLAGINPEGIATALNGEVVPLSTVMPQCYMKATRYW